MPAIESLFEQLTLALSRDDSAKVQELVRLIQRAVLREHHHLDEFELRLRALLAEAAPGSHGEESVSDIFSIQRSSAERSLSFATRAALAAWSVRSGSASWGIWKINVRGPRPIDDQVPCHPSLSSSEPVEIARAEIPVILSEGQRRRCTWEKKHGAGESRAIAGVDARRRVGQCSPWLGQG